MKPSVGKFVLFLHKRIKMQVRMTSVPCIAEFGTHVGSDPTELHWALAAA